jgi:hypothetical protein
MTIGRVVGVSAALLLLMGAAVFFFFRYAFTAEGVYRVKTSLGTDAASPERHIVLADFQGWAVIRFSVEGAPPLHSEGDTLIVEYPSSGQLETSTPAPDHDGFLHREYYRRVPEGLVPLTRMGEVWGEYNMRTSRDETGGIIDRSAGFFVGTMDEFRQAERPMPGLEILELPDRTPDQ